MGWLQIPCNLLTRGPLSAPGSHGRRGLRGGPPLFPICVTLGQGGFEPVIPCRGCDSIIPHCSLAGGSWAALEFIPRVVVMGDGPSPSHSEADQSIHIPFTTASEHPHPVQSWTRASPSHAGLPHWALPLPGVAAPSAARAVVSLLFYSGVWDAGMQAGFADSAGKGKILSFMEKRVGAGQKQGSSGEGNPFLPGISG